MRVSPSSGALSNTSLEARNLSMVDTPLAFVVAEGIGWTTVRKGYLQEEHER